MGKTYYFLNHGRDSQLEEKCPKCNEEFIPHKGGAQCQESKCKDKQLEEKHRRITPAMVNHCLPKFNANVYTPNNGEGAEITDYDFDLGWSYNYSKSVYIPWYTLRSKKEFFDTVAHEAGHILSYEERLISSEKKVIEKFVNMVNEYENLPPLVLNSQIGRNCETMIENYYLKHKKIIDAYTDNMERYPNEAKWIHGQRSFYPAYVKCFNSLVNSPYSKYNYNNSFSPRSFDEVRYYRPKKNK